MTLEKDHQEVTPSSEAESKDVFVELGCGHLSSMGSRLTNETDFIAVDIDTHELDEGRWIYGIGEELFEIAPHSVTFIQGDIEKVPLANSVAQEVYIANLFSSSALLSPLRFSGVVEEGYRILKKDGIVSVLESHTPEFADKETVKGMFENLGFRLVQELSPVSTPTEWEGMSRRYVHQELSRDFKPTSDFLQFIKNGPTERLTT